MPTTRSASADSRQMMKMALPMTLLGDDPALRGLRMEFVEEGVFAGLQRIDRDRRARTRRQHFLDLERLALEFDRRLAFVADVDLDLLAGGNDELRWLELAVLCHDRELRHVLRAREQRHHRETCGDQRHPERHVQYPPFLP